MLHVSQYDEGSRTYNFYLFQNGVAFTPPTGAEVTLEARRPDQFGVVVDATVDGSVASVTLSGDVTALAGTVTCQLSVTSGEDTLGSANFIILVEESPVTRGGLMPRYYYLRELPDAYRTVVDDLISRGVFYSCGGTGEDTIVNLSDDVCRLLLTLRDVGAFANKSGEVAHLALSDYAAGLTEFPSTAAGNPSTLQEVFARSIQRRASGIPEFLPARVVLDEYGDTADVLLRAVATIWNQTSRAWTTTFSPVSVSEVEVLHLTITGYLDTGEVRAEVARNVYEWHGTQAQYDFLLSHDLIEAEKTYYILEDET